jgi:hypothetical protein
MKSKSINAIGLLCCMTTFLCSAPAFAADDLKNLRDSLRSIASEIISSGKEAVTGLSEGVEQGMSEEGSADKAKEAKTREEFAAMLGASVHKAKSLGDGRYEISVALRNDNDFAVRVIGLREIENVVLLDREGFSYLPDKNANQPGSVVALSKSRTRLQFLFSGVEESPTVLRLLGKELAISRIEPKD